MLRLYTDESPGLKVDPVVVLVLSLVFIFSVVALHSMFYLLAFGVGSWRAVWTMDGLVFSFWRLEANSCPTVIAKLTRRFSS